MNFVRFPLPPAALGVCAAVLIAGCRPTEPARLGSSDPTPPEAELASGTPPSAAALAPEKAESPAVQGSATNVAAPPDVAAPPAQATKAPSGLALLVLVAGKGGAKPGPEDTVRVHYTGWTQDGRIVDSSVLRHEPATFGVSQVIKGWTEGLQTMTVGEKKRFWIPAELAYGETPMRPGAPSGQLTFDVELLEIIPAPQAPAEDAAPDSDEDD